MVRITRSGDKPMLIGPRGHEVQLLLEAELRYSHSRGLIGQGCSASQKSGQFHRLRSNRDGRPHPILPWRRLLPN
jgi:hypothetical protein